LRDAGGVLRFSYGAVVEETCGYDEEYHFGVRVYTLCCVVLCCVVLCCVDTYYMGNTLYG
jgi:hypothetical protein